MVGMSAGSVMVNVCAQYVILVVYYGRFQAIYTMLYIGRSADHTIYKMAYNIWILQTSYPKYLRYQN